METLGVLVLCSVMLSHCAQGFFTTEYGSSRPDQNCGGRLYSTEGNFTSPNYPYNYPDNMDCVWVITPGREIIELRFLNVMLEGSDCRYDAIYVYDGPDVRQRLLGRLCGHQTSTFHSTGSTLTVRFRSDSSQTYQGFQAVYRVVANASCRYNCGYLVGNCSCSSSCQYYGSCCHDYDSQCLSTSPSPPETTDQPSCRYNCESHLGSCSCSSSCQYYGDCCYDYYSHCSVTTPPQPDVSTDQPSCRYNCGSHHGSCSCSSSCQYYGNCCYDYYSQCLSTSPSPPETTDQPSCRYNCGSHQGSCSCSSSCQYYGNCCYDYYSHCSVTTPPQPEVSTDQPSCRYNCGSHQGSCSCSSSCQYYGNCCYDYYSQCLSTSPSPPETTDQPSCRYNCGSHQGSCSCSSSCQYYGNCCYDYYSHCSVTTPPQPEVSTDQPSCRYNCGSHHGSCSCSSSCRYYGNCCYDYYSYCSVTTPEVTTAHRCGGSLTSSGSFSSPGYPGYYPENSYCVWQLRALNNHRIYLSFTDLQLDNCCSCDYVAVYDGPSVNSRPLGKLCNTTLDVFQSSSAYITVLLRTDSSVVGRGFRAEFTSSLSPGSGRVECSTENMNIVIEKSYLNSLGYVGNDLYLNDQNCRPRISAYQLSFSFPVNTCGTVRTLVNGRVVYANAVRAYKSDHDEITRQPTIKLNVNCRMEPDTTVQIMYVAHSQDNATIVGIGRFNGSMAFYTNSNFNTMVTQVPYEVTLNQFLYVQVRVTRDSSLVVFLDTCVASPSPNDFHTRPYHLVRNGCAMDSTYYAYTSGHHSFARFRFRAFQFLRAQESVYLQCKVVVCPAADTGSRCRRGCSRRRARALRASEDSHTVVLGPVTLRDLESQDKGSVTEEKEEPKMSIDI